MSTLKDKTSGVSAASAASGLPALGLPAAALLKAIAGWDDLTEARRRAMTSAVRTTQRILAVAEAGQRNCDGVPLSLIEEWTCARLNAALWAKPPSFFRLDQRSHANVVGLLRVVLIRLDLHEDAGPRRNVLSPAWQALFDALPTNERRHGLVLFLRFCTLRGIEPCGIEAAGDVLDRFEAWCREAILHGDAAGMARRTAGNWTYARGVVPGWPQLTLTRVGVRDWYTVPLETLPASFQADLASYLGRLSSGPGSIFAVEALYAGNPKETKRNAPCRAMRPATIAQRRYSIRLAVTALVAQGVPVDELTSLRALFAPIDRVRLILAFHRERRRARLEAAGEMVIDEDELRSSQLGTLAETLRQVATYHLDLPEGDLAFIRRGSEQVRLPAQRSMTEKNASRLRGLSEPRVYAMLLHLPGTWMAEAANPMLKPKEAALWAMYAAALEILLVCPLRRGNLVRLTLDRQLHRPSPRALITDLLVPGAEVKNREPVTWRIEPGSARLIETYITRHRQHLLSSPNRHLLPGLTEGSHRNEAEFGAELARRVMRAIGAPFNVHLVRHFSVARWLRHNPGSYAMAARLVGHRSLKTTMDYYCGLEFDAAARHSNALLTGERERTSVIAEAAFKRRPRRPGPGSKPPTRPGKPPSSPTTPGKGGDHGR